jgi:hypothetical protein
MFYIVNRATTGKPTCVNLTLTPGSPAAIVKQSIYGYSGVSGVTGGISGISSSDNRDNKFKINDILSPSFYIF